MISATIKSALSTSLLLLPLVGNPLLAKDIVGDPHDSVSPQVQDRDEWLEEPSDVPPYPLEANLLEFHVDQSGPKFRFFIDSLSIDTGENDGVIRYTLVIRSHGGSENVMFEAMHCSAQQYKTFAFGTRQKKFRPVRKPRWRAIPPATGNNAYRHELWKFYLCEGEVRLTRNRQQIIDGFKYRRR